MGQRGLGIFACEYGFQYREDFFFRDSARCLFSREGWRGAVLKAGRPPDPVAKGDLP